MVNEMLVTLAATMASTVSLAAVLALFRNVKKDTTALEKRVCLERAETVAAIELLSTTVKRLEAELSRCRHEIEQIPTMAALPAAGVSINLNKRSQALRMHRQGESLEQISSVLGIPHGELELLVKLQNVVRYTAGATA